VQGTLGSPAFARRYGDLLFLSKGKLATQPLSESQDGGTPQASRKTC
jgi:hypothetical protein